MVLHRDGFTPGELYNIGLGSPNNRQPPFSFLQKRENGVGADARREKPVSEPNRMK
jgi:hypothetical protein